MTLSWSISRDKALDACERRYYYDYVMGARSNSKDARAREIASLKQLKTAFMWQGEVFHELAATYLRRASFSRFDPEDALKSALDKMRRDWAASAISVTSPESADANTFKLFEHHYEVATDDGLLDNAIGFVETRFRRFLAWASAERLLGRLQRAKQVWIEPPTFGMYAPGFLVEGVRVVVKVDLAIHEADGRFAIFDWKTGAPRTSQPGIVDDEAEFQITVYQLWPHLTLNVPLQAIEARTVFVGVDPVLVRTYTLNSETRERALRRVKQGVRRGMALYGDGDYAELSERDFDMARYPGVCRWCSFKRVCQRGTTV